MRGIRELVGGVVMQQTVGPFPLCLVLAFLLAAPTMTRADQPAPTGGELRVVTPGGPVEQCPLKHTDVLAEITGNVAQVEVTQTFQNPYDRKIEAVYVFPLPDRAAVHDMEIRVGDRTIKSLIKRREEARAAYEAARQAGHIAALLDQERPNIFTQSVANILPGAEVVVTIRYFETVPYASGDYEFSFPMVVGPRFIPGAPVKAGESGSSPDTTEVPDASRITPPGLRPETRTGHDISLEVRLDAGAMVRELVSPSHRVGVKSDGRGGDIIRLKEEDSIPNRDFVLRYRVDGDSPNLIVLPHRGEGDGYFLMLVQPEAKPAATVIAPKEMIFVVDCSGSMSGDPIDKVKEAMRYALQGLDPRDTFQIVRFSNGAETFEPAPVMATPGNIERALRYVGHLSGQGGTIMLEGVRTALQYPENPERLRIVSFMTDGYIGNEEAILAYMAKHLGGARLFSFGVGTSVNRYLLDKMAEFGRGAVEYVLPGDDSGKAIRRFYDRIRSPYLTDIQIDWGGLGVSDMYPREIPDLFLGQPITVYGRYGKAGKAEVTLRARLGGRPFEKRFTVQLPARQDEGEAIGTLWARARIEDLSDRLIVGPQPALVEEITRVALAHRLVSKYTSFVAVEDRVDTGPGKPALVEVPVCTPAGVSYDMTYGAPAGGEMKETIRVASASQVTTTQFSSEFVDALPILGRDYQDVLTLAPGVDGDGTPTIHGSRDVDVVTLVDGVSTSDPLTGPRGQKLNLNSIQEIEVRTAGATVEFGRSHGGSVTIDAATAIPGVIITIAARRSEYRAADVIELSVTIENRSGRAVQVPAVLSVADGTARFRVLDPQGVAAADPIQQRGPARMMTLQPGASATLRVLLNGARGYRFVRPGEYRVTLLGASLGLGDSNTLSLMIRP
jgi:Ca-activated chloride channel family protein